MKTQHADNTPYISALKILAELTVQITNLLDENGLDALILGGGDYQSPASSVFATGGLPLVSDTVFNLGLLLLTRYAGSHAM